MQWLTAQQGISQRCSLKSWINSRHRPHQAHASPSASAREVCAVARRRIRLLRADSVPFEMAWCSVAGRSMPERRSSAILDSAEAEAEVCIVTRLRCRVTATAAMTCDAARGELQCTATWVLLSPNP